MQLKKISEIQKRKCQKLDYRIFIKEKGMSKKKKCGGNNEDGE